MSFYANYVKLCVKNGLSPSAAAETMGFSRGAVTRWKTDSSPNYSTVLRVAEFFKVDPVELISGDIEEKTELSKEILMSAEERELLNSWRKADEYTKGTIAYALRKYGFNMLYMDTVRERRVVNYED